MGSIVEVEEMPYELSSKDLMWLGDVMHMFVDASFDNGVAILGVICAQNEEIPPIRRWAMSCLVASATKAELLAIEFGMKKAFEAGLRKS